MHTANYMRDKMTTHDHSNTCISGFMDERYAIGRNNLYPKLYEYVQENSYYVCNMYSPVCWDICGFRVAGLLCLHVQRANHMYSVNSQRENIFFPKIDKHNVFFCSKR